MFIRTYLVNYNLQGFPRNSQLHVANKGIPSFFVCAVRMTEVSDDKVETYLLLYGSALLFQFSAQDENCTDNEFIDESMVSYKMRGRAGKGPLDLRRKSTWDRISE
jgi:hypothetical protein